MLDAIKVALPDGEEIWARVRSDDPIDVAFLDTVHRLDIADLRRTIRGVGGAVFRAAAGLSPDQIGIEFGIELAVKTGRLTSLLAEGAAQASIKVTLAWGNSPDQRQRIDAVRDASIAEAGTVPGR